MQAICHEMMLPSLSQNKIGTSELDPFRSSILGPWSPLSTLHVGPRGTPRITRGPGGWLNLPRGGLPPPILCQLSWRTPRWGQNTKNISPHETSVLHLVAETHQHSRHPCGGRVRSFVLSGGILSRHSEQNCELLYN